jgi:predicted nucleotidyltransferase
LELDRVAVGKAKDFKQVVFVGAYAAIKYGVSRRTNDIDLALATPKTYEEFGRLGYGVSAEGGKKVIRTRDGSKLDVYTRDVSGIPVPRIFATAVAIRVDGTFVKVMCLEALLIAKMRAGRPQDSEDIQRLVALRGKFIRWDVVDSVARDLEASELRGYVGALS